MEPEKLLERHQDVEQRLWALFSHIPTEVRLADELIAERRQEAKREAEE